MTTQSLKSRTTKGIIWSSVDKFAAQGVQFIISIILARILMPKDFGMIGMLAIFFAISQVFIDSGMASGIIQKKNRTDVDFSTVFVFNMVVSILFYFILFFSAPYIARFYEMPQLVPLTRVMSINFVINSLATVQRSRLTINLDFKKIAMAHIFSVFVSGIVAIIVALEGYGVWALVTQNLVRTIIAVVLFWFLSKWKPSLKFSPDSFRQLFGFGSNLLLTGLYAQTLQNSYKIVIGKVYSATDLGFYSKAKNYSELVSDTLFGALQQVTFPVMASLQEDRTRLVSVYSRLIRMTAFFNFPTMIIMAVLSEPLVRVLLTDKWAPSIVLLQLICFSRLFYPMSALNMSILNAIGRSDLFLKVDLSKAPVIIISLVITIPFGVKAMVIGQVITAFISFFINAYLPGRMFGYGALKQLRDLIPTIISTCIMAVSVLLVTKFFSDLYVQLFGGFLVGLIVFLIMSFILRIEELQEIKSLWTTLKNHMKN